MKKFIIIVLGLVLIFNLCYSQNPYTIIELDSSIRKVVDVQKLNESEFIIVGNSKGVIGQYPNIFIAQISTNGEIIWKKEHKGYMQWFSSVCAKTDGNYYIAMEDTTHAAILLETNHVGDSLWSFISTEPELNNKCFGSVKEFSNGKFVISECLNGLMIPFQVTESRYYIMDEDGTIIHNFIANKWFACDIETVSENEFLAAEVYSDVPSEYDIIKYNTNGEVIYSDSCAFSSLSDNYLWELNKISVNQFYATGRYLEYPESFGLITKINGTGQIEYCSLDTVVNYLLGVAQTDNGRIVYCGMKGDDKMIIGEMVSSEIFIPKIEIIDYFDNYFSTTDILISDNYVYVFTEIHNGPSTSGIIKIPVDSIVSSIKQVNYGSLKIYPNPAKDYVVFEIPTTFTNNGVIPNRGAGQGAGVRNPPAITQLSKTSTFKVCGNSQGVSQSLRSFDMTVVVVNAFGQTIATLPVKAEKTVWDCREVQSGIYFYVVEIDGAVLSGKVVIQK